MNEDFVGWIRTVEESERDSVWTIQGTHDFWSIVRGALLRTRERLDWWHEGVVEAILVGIKHALLYHPKQDLWYPPFFGSFLSGVIGRDEGLKKRGIEICEECLLASGFLEVGLAWTNAEKNYELAIVSDTYCRKAKQMISVARQQLNDAFRGKNITNVDAYLQLGDLQEIEGYLYVASTVLPPLLSFGVAEVVLDYLHPRVLLSARHPEMHEVWEPLRWEILDDIQRLLWRAAIRRGKIYPC